MALRSFLARASRTSGNLRSLGGGLSLPSPVHGHHQRSATRPVAFVATTNGISSSQTRDLKTITDRNNAALEDEKMFCFQVRPAGPCVSLVSPY